MAPAFALPTRSDLDLKLVSGAALFGVGWGLGGLCPGPALAGLLQGVPQVFVFAAAMAAGMLLHDVAGAARGASDDAPDPVARLGSGASRRLGRRAASWVSLLAGGPSGATGAAPREVDILDKPVEWAKP